MLRFNVMTIAALAASACLASAAYAAVVVEYNAATATGTPSSEPDWTLESAPEMTLAGGVLQQNDPAGTTSTYRSIETPGLMVRNTVNPALSSDYQVQFATRAIGTTAATDYYTNSVVIWADNTFTYTAALYRAADGTGNLRSGGGSNAFDLPVIPGTNVNWSTSHDFRFVYTGASDSFAVYVDGVQVSTVPAAGVNQLASNGPEPFFQNRVIFGDRLTGGGGDSRVDWSSVRLFNDAAVPEPATLGVAAAAIVGLTARRRRARTA